MSRYFENKNVFNWRLKLLKLMDNQADCRTWSPAGVGNGKDMTAIYSETVTLE